MTGVQTCALPIYFSTASILDGTDSDATNENSKIITEIPAATINLAFSTSADTANQVTLNYSTREIEAIAIANATFGFANTPSMDIDVTGKADTNDLTSNTVIQDTDLNSLIFPVGFENTKGIGTQGTSSYTAQGISFQRKAVIDISFSNMASAASVTITSPTGTTFETEGGTGTLSAPKANYILVAVTAGSSGGGGLPRLSDGTDATIVAGEIIECTVAYVAGNQVSITPKRDGLAFNRGAFTGKVYATVDLVGKQGKSVSKVTATAISAASNIGSSARLLDGDGDGTGTNCTAGQLNTRLTAGHSVQAAVTGTASLGVADVIEVTNIIEANTGGTSAATQFPTALVSAAIGNTAHNNNITSRYSFNNGQKDNFLDHASITLKSGQNPPANNVLITFNYFSHNSANGYVSVDSFANIDYEDIPAFISPTTGVRKERRDCLDFRPHKGFANGATNAGILQTQDDMPDAKVNMSANVAYYLPRKDKLTLTKDRVFKVLEGISSENPGLPADDEDSMTLYNLDIPAYTHNPSDVDTQYIDNRRFTMRDIGKIEKRVDQIEYYTALSLLEKEANDLSIKDSATNTERFKNGILVDSFNGHNIGDEIGRASCRERV